jgi:ATP-dependent Lhr-like helicase
VSKDDYATLLRHLISIDHIQETEERGLIVGLAGESVVRNYKFYAVFAGSDEYTVLSDGQEIGSIPSAPPLGERFGLAGRTWEVVELDDDRRVIYARPVRGHVRSRWHGGTGETHTRILQRMRQVLIEDIRYPYLQKGAMARLEEARKLAGSAGIDRRNVVPLGGDRVCVFPWMGTVAFRTLLRTLGVCESALGAHVDASYEPFYLILRCACDADEISRRLVSLASANLTAEALVSPDEVPRLQKYDEFIPDALLRKAFGADSLDVDEMKVALNGWAKQGVDSGAR